MSFYLVIGAALVFSLMRFVNLDFASFWMDEALSIIFAQVGKRAFGIAGLADYNPQLYYIFLSPIVKVFGVSEISVRALSVFFGAASITLPIFYFWKWSRVLCVLSVVLVGFSRIHFDYSREARSYIVFYFFALWALLFLLQKLRSEKPWSLKDILITSALLAITCNLHYCGVIFTAGYFLILALFQKKLFLRLPQILGMAALVALSLLPEMQTLLRHSENAPGWLRGSPGNLGYAIFQIMKFYLGSGLLVWSVVALVWVALFAGNNRKNPLRYALWISILMWVVPLGISLLVIYVVLPSRLYSLHMFAIMPGLLVSIAISLKIIIDSFKRWALIFPGVFMLLYAEPFFAGNPWQAPPKTDTRAAVAYTLGKNTPCRLIFETGAPTATFTYLRMNGAKDTPKNLGNKNESLEPLKKRMCDHLFVFATFHNSPYLEVQNLIDKNWNFVEKQSFTGMTVFYYAWAGR